MALYHQYRPQTFADVVGQEPIITTITNQLLSDRVSHAYLFCGARGIGKTTTARLLAKAVNCTNRTTDNAEPCNTCDSCTAITKGATLDVIEIDAASHTGVDHVREQIIENANFKPSQFAYKVFIIDEVHMLSTSAFNALLKTLEEPPSYAIFILATTELHKLPATIVSRCQRFTFQNIPQKQLLPYLENIAKKEGKTIDHTVLQRIGYASEGCLRDAMSLLDQLCSLETNPITAKDAQLFLPGTATEEIQQLFGALVRQQTADALAVITKQAQEGASFSHVMDDLIDLLRFALQEKVSPALLAQQGDPSLQAFLQDTVTDISTGTLVHLIEEALHYRKYIQSSPLPQLPLEMFLVAQAHPKSAPTPVVANVVAAPAPSPTPTPVPQPTVTITPPAPPTVPSPPPSIPEDVPVSSPPVTPPKPVPPPPAPPTPPPVAPTPATEETAQPEQPATPPPATGALTTEQVQQLWPKVIEALEKDSPSLVFVLTQTKVSHIQGETVTLAVSSKFYRDKLLKTNTKQQIEEALQTCANQHLIINAVHDASTKPPAQSPKDMSDLAAQFGGEVV